MSTTFQIDPTFETAIRKLHREILPMPHDGWLEMQRLGFIDPNTIKNWTPIEWLLWDLYRHLGSRWENLAHQFLLHFPYNMDVARWIGIVEAIFNAKDEYSRKFGHYPVDPFKFVYDYINKENGRELVLAEDTY